MEHVEGFLVCCRGRMGWLAFGVCFLLAAESLEVVVAQGGSGPEPGVWGVLAF